MFAEFLPDHIMSGIVARNGRITPAEALAVLRWKESRLVEDIALRQKNESLWQGRDEQETAAILLNERKVELAVMRWAISKLVDIPSR